MSRFIVVVPSKYPRQFLGVSGLAGGPIIRWVAEYPDANKFGSEGAARAIASKHPGAQVYTVEGYEAGSGPILQVPA